MSKIVRHPQFDAKRLSNDIAVMITAKYIGDGFKAFYTLMPRKWL